MTVHGRGCPPSTGIGFGLLGADHDQMNGQDRKGLGIRYNPDRVLVPASLFCLVAGGEGDLKFQVVEGEDTATQEVTNGGRQVVQ